MNSFSYHFRLNTLLIEIFKIVCLVFLGSIISCEHSSLAPEGQQVAQRDLLRTPISTGVVEVLHIEERDAEDTRYNEVLETTVYGLLETAKNKEFREIVAKEVLKQFDGDDNVLIKSLKAACRNRGIDLPYLFTSSINKHVRGNANKHLQRMEQLVNGLSYDSKKLFPQIYIPFIDKVNMDSDPIICLNLDGDEVAPGYKLNEVGELEEYMLDETFAKQNLVWVVSMNETVRSEEDIVELTRIRTELFESGMDSLHPQSYSASRGWTSSVGQIFINRIYITDKKETWLNGKADVSYASTHFNMPDIWTGSYPCATFSANAKLAFKKVGSGDLYSWITVSGGSGGSYLLAGLGELEPDEGLFVLFYEKDNRKKHKKTVKFLSSCGDTFTYISKESAYGYTTCWSETVTWIGGAPEYTNPTYSRFEATNDSNSSYDQEIFTYSGGNKFELNYHSN